MVDWNEHTDVIVVGSGLAGLAAAIESRRAGAEVIVLEKMPITGGNTRISDGGLAAPCNYLQQKKGITDSPDLFYTDMRKAGLGLNHPELLKVVADQAAEAIAWTRDELGVTYLDRLDRFGGHSVARCLTTRSHSGKDIVKAQVDHFRKLGGKIRTRCLMTALETHAGGAVCGVRVRRDYRFSKAGSGSEWRIAAARAVVLASGGFSSDVEFRKRQDPRLDASIGTTNHQGATVNGLAAALKIGAVPVHLSWIQTGPWACADELGYGKGSRFASYSIYPTGILVDPATGRRIVNEWSDRRTRSDAIIATGHACVGITDAAGARQDLQSLEHCLKTGKVRHFETLTALAAEYGMPAETFVDTVCDYNRHVSEGLADPFGKPLDKGLQPLMNPPFYAIRLWPKVHYTPGGVGIDAKARVIDLYGRPIRGLFAAGEVCGGIHGASRLGSCALTECLVFGRIAGRCAAAQPLRSFNC